MNVFKRKGRIRSILTSIVVGGLVFTIGVNVTSSVNHSNSKTKLVETSNQVDLELSDASDKIKEIEESELRSYTTMGTLQKDQVNVLERVTNMNESSLYNNTDYLFDVLVNNGGTMTRAQYDEFSNSTDAMTNYMEELAKSSNFETSGIKEKLSNYAEQNTANNKLILENASDVSKDLKIDTEKLSKETSAVIEQGFQTTKGQLSESNKSVANLTSSYSSDILKSNEDFFNSSKTELSSFYPALLLAIQEDDTATMDALINWYTKSDANLMTLKNKVLTDKRMLMQTISLRAKLAGDFSGGVSQAGSVVSWDELASAINSGLTSHTVPTNINASQPGVMQYKRHHHTFGTDADGEYIYKEDLAAYCDSHDIPYSFSGETFYCATNPATIVSNMGGDNSTSCYTSAGHTHSSDAAGHSNNNVKYTGHNCSWENYQYESRCGASLKDKGSSKVVDGYNTNGDPIYRTQYHGTCPNGHGDTRSWSAMPSTCGYTVTKTGQRYTCGEPANTWKPTRCGYSEDEPVKAMLTINASDATTGNDIEH